VDTIRSVEPSAIEIEYELSAPIPGLRVGLYLMSTRGEYVFTSFDTDDPERYEQFAVRPAGRYVSRCLLPANLLNEGRFVVGVNASAYRVRRYFQDEQALTFTVDATGAPGTQWPEPRLGAVRPRLEWQVDKRGYSRPSYSTGGRVPVIGLFGPTYPTEIPRWGVGLWLWNVPVKWLTP